MLCDDLAVPSLIGVPHCKSRLRILEVLIRSEVLPTYYWRTLPLKNRTLEFQPLVCSVLDYEECIFSGSEAQQTDIISTR